MCENKWIQMINVLNLRLNCLGSIWIQSFEEIILSQTLFVSDQISD